MSKPTHENIVEFKVYGADALFSDVLTRTGKIQLSDSNLRSTEGHYAQHLLETNDCLVY